MLYKLSLVFVMLITSLTTIAQREITSFESKVFFQKIKDQKEFVREDFRPYFIDTVSKYEVFVNNVFERTTGFTGRISFVGQSHMRHVGDSLKKSHEWRVMRSQEMVEKILSAGGYQVVANEGLSEKECPPWSTTYILEDYKHFDSSALQFRRVPLLYVQNRLPGELIATESPFVHRLHEIAFEEKNTSFEELLLELRSLIAFCLLLDEMQRKGYVEGALVIGTDHLDGLIAFARHVGIRFEVHRTSEAWAEYSKK
jgi:hypothetical protein